MDFLELRTKYPQFVYQGFEIDFDKNNLTIVFDFKILPDLSFRPTVIFPGIDHNRLKKINPEVLRNLIFNLGMIEMLSYWKVTCSSEIIIRAGFLNGIQTEFWNNLLIKGLGEFYYNNKIDFTNKDLIKFTIDASMQRPYIYSDALKDRDFILVGGGKDSAVTMDILSKSGREVNGLSLNPTNSTVQVIKVAGFANPIYIQRNIDPKLLELNKAGYLNGHTPFSAYLAFLSIIASVLYDYKNIIVSNESSSNEGNVTWKNTEINHQYSKTFEFENLFKNYCQQNLSYSTNYFSFLRPLSELQIAALFAKDSNYFKAFKSCNKQSFSSNKNSKLNTWCGKCPKCVSTYLSLYPFLGSNLIPFFGRDLFQDETIIPVIYGLLRLNDVLKPFECVATIEETKLAIYLSVEKVKAEGKELPVVLKQVANFSSGNTGILKQWNPQNNLPDFFRKLLESKLNETK